MSSSTLTCLTVPHKQLVLGFTISEKLVNKIIQLEITQASKLKGLLIYLDFPHQTIQQITYGAESHIFYQINPTPPLFYHMM